MIFVKKRQMGNLLHAIRDRRLWESHGGKWLCKGAARSREPALPSSSPMGPLRKYGAYVILGLREITEHCVTYWKMRGLRQTGSVWRGPFLIIQSLKSYLVDWFEIFRFCSHTILSMSLTCFENFWFSVMHFWCFCWLYLSFSDLQLNIFWFFMTDI